MATTRKVALLGLVAYALVRPAASAPLSAPGISVSGSGSQNFKICSTCPDVGANEFDTKGGNNVGSAVTTGDGVNSFEWLAAGTLVGPNQLPVLKARVSVDDPSRTDPSLGIGFVSATASALGLQRCAFGRVVRSAPSRDCVG